MEHYSIAHNARTALLAALLMVALAAGESFELKPTLINGLLEQYVEITYYVNATIGLDAFFLLPPLANFPTDTDFGAAIVLDSAVTSGPEPNSQPLGTVKGFFLLDSADNADGRGQELVLTVIFNDASGFGAGTTLSYRGYEQLDLSVREVSITGGTGKFRLARGWAHTSNSRGGGTSFEYHIVNHIFYYDI